MTVGPTGSASLQALQAKQAAAQQAYDNAVDADRSADASTYTLQASVNTDQGAVTSAQSAYDQFNTQTTSLNTAATTADKTVTSTAKALADADKAVTDAKKAETDAKTAVTTATTAQTTAQTTYTTAGTTLTSAKTAQSTADTAQRTAQTAVTTAKDLVTADDAALKTAEADLKTAQADQKTADKNVTDADTKLATAGTDLTKADAEVRTATTGVATAQLASDKAKAAVGPAQTAVTGAKGALAKASSDVSTLQGQASTADAAANSAASAASSAESAANAAEARARANPNDAGLQSAAKTARARATSARSRANTAKSHASDAHRLLDAAKAAEAAAKKALAAAEKALKDAQDAADKAAKELAAKQKELKEKQEAQEKAKTAKAEAQKAADDAKTKAADAKAKAEAALKTRDTAKTKVETDKTALEKAEKTADDATKKAEDAKKAVDKATEAQEKAKKELDKAKEATTEAKEKLTAATTKVTTATSAQTTAKTAADKAKTDATAAHKKVDDVKSKQVDAKSKLDAAKAKLDKDKAALTSQTSAAKAAQDKIASTKSALDAAIAAEKKAENAGMTAQQRKMLQIDGPTTSEKDQAAKDAAAIDKEVTPAEAAQLKKDQEEFDKQLAAAKSVKTTSDANSSGFASFIEKTRQGIALNAHEQALYSAYFETHDYYVDNGTVYSASYDSRGKKIVLDRNGTPVQPAGTKPDQFVKDQNIAIANSGARDTTTTVRTKPGSTTDGSSSSYKEVLHTDAKGAQTARETEDRSTTLAEDKKTTVTTVMSKSMDEKDRLRKADQTTTAVNGTKTETQQQGAEFDEQGRTTVETSSYKAVDGNKSTTKAATVHYDPATGFRTTEHDVDENIDGDKKTTQVSDTNFASDVPVDTKIVGTDSSAEGKSGNSEQSLTYDSSGKVATSQTTTYDKDGKPTVRTDDATHITGVNYVRNGDNKFEADGSVATPNDVLKPSQALTATVNAGPNLLGHADAKSIDATLPAEGSARRVALQDQQGDYDSELKAATTPAERDAVMAKYWNTHDIYFANAPRVSDTPLALAAEYTAPSGSDKPYGYVTMARTGQVVPSDAEGVTTTADILMRQDASTGDTSQTVKAKSRDGKQDAVDEIYNTVTNPAGKVTLQEASRTSTTADGAGGNQVSRQTFDDNGVQLTGYDATSSYDGQDTKLSERSDTYANGVLSGSKVHQDDKSRDWNQGAVDAFSTEMDLFADDLSSGADFDIDKDHNKITVPTTGTHRTVTDTEIQYDSAGKPIYQKSDQKVWDVQSTRDVSTDDDGKTTDTADANGVKVTTSETTSTWGAPGGTAPIMDNQGAYTVAGQFTTHLRVRSFDPDDGKSEGHQVREVDDVTTSGSVGTDGKQTIEHSGPFTQSILTEDGDDDWYYTQKVFKTDQKTGAVETDDDGKPKEYGEGDSYWDPTTKTQKTFDTSPNKARESNEWTDDVGQWWDDHSHMISAAMMVVGTVLAFTPIAPVGVALLAGGGAIALSNDLPDLIENPSWKGALMVGLDVAAIVPGVGQISAMGNGFLRGARLAEGATTIGRAGQAWAAGKSFLQTGAVVAEEAGALGTVANAAGRVQKLMSLPLLPVAGDASRLAKVGSSLTSLNGGLGTYVFGSQVVDSVGKIRDGEFSLMDAGNLAFGIALTGHGLRAAGWGPAGVTDAARAAGELSPAVNGADVRKIVIGANKPTDLVISTIEKAPIGEPLRMEVRKFDDPTVVAAVAKRVAAGGQVEIVIDRHNLPGSKFGDEGYANALKLQEAGAKVLVYEPGSDLYLHGKITGTGSNTVLSTSTYDAESRIKAEVAAALKGDTAKAANDLTAGLTKSIETGDPRYALEAAAAARKKGIVVNDEANGITSLSDTMKNDFLTAQKGERVSVLTSELDATSFTAGLVEMKQRGVDVVVRVGKIAPADAALLKAAGIDYTVTRPKLGPGETMEYAHGNVISRQDIRTGDTHLYVGSGYTWDPHLNGVGSREIGLVLQGNEARKVLEAQLRYTSPDFDPRIVTHSNAS